MNKTQQALKKYTESKQAAWSHHAKQMEAEDEFIASLFDGTKEEAEAVYAILQWRTYKNEHEAKICEKLGAEWEPKRKFFGKLYEKIFGKGE
jgi:hypothetical protein